MVAETVGESESGGAFSSPAAGTCSDLCVVPTTPHVLPRGKDMTNADARLDTGIMCITTYILSNSEMCWHQK